MYDINEVVSILNKKVSLDNFNINNDKRRSNVWTLRLVREYFSRYNIKGRKIGKRVFYNNNDIENLREIMISKHTVDIVKIKYLSGANNSESVNIDNIALATKETASELSSLYGSKDEFSLNLKSIGEKTKEDPSKTNNKNYVFLNEVANKTINITDQILINYSVTNAELIDQLKTWLKNIGE